MGKADHGIELDMVEKILVEIADEVISRKSVALPESPNLIVESHGSVSNEGDELVNGPNGMIGGVVYHARRSSIWSRAGAGWLLRFHQGTPFNEGA